MLNDNNNKVQPLLTVFTPAYNRAHTIERTYESLCRQTCKDFEWLIIDDGSLDNTSQLIYSWLKEDTTNNNLLNQSNLHEFEGWCEAGFKIRYIWQENQGMHGAHNTAYRNITTELNTCIDSDDWMPNDAVERIVNFWSEHGSERYAGFVGLDATPDGKIIGSKFPENMTETTLSGYYAQGGSGDKKLVYRTDVITKYPEYPLFEGERYVGLAYKYMLIDQDYKLLTLNVPLVTVEYQPDGSSFSMYKQYWNNPQGFAFFRKTEMQYAPSIKRQFIVCAHYVSSSIISKNWHFLKESPKRLMTLLCIPAGVGLYLIIRHKVKSNKQMQFR